MASLLDDVGPDARKLLDILMSAWSLADQWPIRQFVSHEMASDGLDPVEVLGGIPEWGHHYRLVRDHRHARAMVGPDVLTTAPDTRGRYPNPSFSQTAYLGAQRRTVPATRAATPRHIPAPLLGMGEQKSHLNELSEHLTLDQRLLTRRALGPIFLSAG